MVDVGEKTPTRRAAVAFAEVRMSPRVVRALKSRKNPKGDAFSAARVAGIVAAKRVDELIPLCHPLMVDQITVEFKLKRDRIEIRAEARCEGKTGVEMEAMTAASVAALTLYDMAKSEEKGIVIGPLALARKSGGRSGLFKNPRFDSKVRGGGWL